MSFVCFFLYLAPQNTVIAEIRFCDEMKGRHIKHCLPQWCFVVLNKIKIKQEFTEKDNRRYFENG